MNATCEEVSNQALKELVAILRKPYRDVCNACSGTGLTSADNTTCPKCRGTGQRLLKLI